MNIIAICLLLWTACTAFAAKPFPPSPRAYVHNEGVLSAPAAERLSATLSAFERETGHQFVVALFDSLEGENLESYSTGLFRAWKIGDAKRNDGLLLALFYKDRLWRVEVGYGLEGVVTDLEAGEIARREGVPHFKSGRFDEGVLSIAAALIARVKTGAPSAPRRSGADDPVIPGLMGLAWAFHFGFMMWLGAAAAAAKSPALRMETPKVTRNQWAVAVIWLIILILYYSPWQPKVIIACSGAFGWVLGYGAVALPSEKSLRQTRDSNRRYWSSGGGYSGGSSSDSFSGGGGSSGGGGASGSW